MKFFSRKKNPDTTWKRARNQHRQKQKPRGKNIFVKRKSSKVDLFRILKAAGDIFSKVVLVLALGYGSFHAYIFMTTSPKLAITKVTFEGNEKLGVSELNDWTGAIAGQNIFSLNLKEHSANLMKHPWVRNVSIERKLPKRVHVVIEERKPFSRIRLGNIYLVDNYGILLARAEAEHDRFPLITGINAKEIVFGKNVVTEDVIRGLSAMHYMNRMNFFLNDPIDTLHMDNSHTLTLTSRKRGIKIRLAAKQINKGFENLKIILGAIKTNAAGINHIDLSFKDKVIIKQTNTDDSSKKI
jgi:cell division septal protein FtsQ